MSGKSAHITPVDVNSEQNFGTLYTFYYKRFFRYAYYYVNDSRTAEDILHDAIVYYWENRDRLADGTDVLGYILVTVRNKCLNHLKHLQVESDYNKKVTRLHDWEVKARIMTLEDASYDTLATQDINRIVAEALAKLPAQTREIFIKNRFQNLSRKDIAHEMGVSVQKIDYHIHKANDHLAKALSDYLPLLLLFFQKIV